jgi:SpoVK/Ycf46/Vps4 family AAA+-type ATPase
MTTKSQQTNADFTALLRARNTLFWFVSAEELRVERAIVEAAGAAKYEVVFWDCDQGFTDSSGKVIEPAQDPNYALQQIRGIRTRRVYVMRDLAPWLRDPSVLRRLRSLERELQNAPRDQARAIVVLTPSSEVPPELSDHAIVIDYPLPEREEIAAILDDATGALPEELAKSAAPNGVRDAAIDAALGLTAKGASNCYARSLVTSKRIDPALVTADKKQVIAREKVLTWYDPDPRGLAAVGGLELLKEWLDKRRLALTKRARDYGIPAPRGMLLVGPPGTGKSLTAKCVASAWGLPLLRLDLGALRSKYVGESEANIRKALNVAETVSPCVLWLDEIEKALAGAGGPQGDGGVAADALGAVLSWMQERKGSVFVVATANNVEALPPELLRKGRFDELFFIDLPTSAERVDILRTAIRQHGRDPESIGDLGSVARVTEGFTGSEIAAIVPDALFTSFADGERELTDVDLRHAAKSVVPLSKTAADKINALREWAKSRTRLASRPEEAAARGSRALDL